MTLVGSLAPAMNKNYWNRSSMSVFGLGGARSDVRALLHKTRSETPRLGLRGLHLKDILNR